MEHLFPPKVPLPCSQTKAIVDFRNPDTLKCVHKNAIIEHTIALITGWPEQYFTMCGDSG